MKLREKIQNNNLRKSLTERRKLFLEKQFAQDSFFRSRIVLWLGTLSLAANIANWIILAIFIRSIDVPIILHYNVYFGVDMMGNWKLAYIMPAVGLILFIANLSLANYFYRNKERIASYVLLIAALMIEMSLIIASIGIIIINY